MITKPAATVGDLIEILKQFPSDLPILVSSSSHNTNGERQRKEYAYNCIINDVKIENDVQDGMKYVLIK